MLLAEDLVGLVWDRVKGRPLVPVPELDAALVAAVVLELRAGAHLETDEYLRLSCRDTTITGIEPWDRVLLEVGGSTPDVHDVVDHCGEQMTQLLLWRLCRDGQAQRQQRSVLGFDLATRWVLRPDFPAADVTRGVSDVLLGVRAPTARERDLLTLVAGLDSVGPLVPLGSDVSVLELRRRARRCAYDDALRLAVIDIIADRRTVDPWSGRGRSISTAT